MTVQEISSILHHQLTPIIFVINNSGDTIERLIFGQKSRYNDIVPWKYHQLPQVLSDLQEILSLVVQTTKELEQALHQAKTANKFTFI